MRALVAGAGGFIGGHLVKRLLNDGYEVRAVDIKSFSDWHQRPVHPTGPAYSSWISAAPSWDLRRVDVCEKACEDIDEVYNLAADMGGMGYISSHKYECMQSVLINTNLLNAAIAAGVRKYFYASSACVYPAYRQTGEFGFSAEALALKEDQAYPAMPEDGYGWEKLFSERMCRHAYEDRGLEVRVARYHNVYGPHGTWEGGREKAPAAMCRKVAECAVTGKNEIEIWGDGEQTRSFIYVDDCIEGTRRLMESNHTDPINIGSSELVSINQLAHLVENIALRYGYDHHHRYGYDIMPTLDWVYDLNAPQGVRGRNSNNTLIKQVLGWEPSMPLNTGLKQTYEWIHEQVRSAHANDVHGSVVR